MSKGRILVIGAGGYVGSSICENLTANGYDVSGLARSTDSVKYLESKGYGAAKGSFEDLPHLAKVIDGFDGTIITATIPFENETENLKALLEQYVSTDRPLIFTSGTAILSIPTPGGEWRQENFAEDEPFECVPWMQVRLDTENMVRSYADQRVNSMVIRPPLIWGRGKSFQIPAIFDSISKTGSACYRGAGLNLYSNVHVDDLAEIYRLAIERGKAGALYHAVAGEANFRSLAEAAAHAMKCDAKSINPEEAVNVWGERFATLFFGVSSRSRAVRTREELGWEPKHLDLVEDVRNGSYKQRYSA